MTEVMKMKSLFSNFVSCFALKFTRVLIFYLQFEAKIIIKQVLEEHTENTKKNPRSCAYSKRFTIVNNLTFPRLCTFAFEQTLKFQHGYERYGPSVFRHKGIKALCHVDTQ